MERLTKLTNAFREWIVALAALAAVFGLRTDKTDLLREPALWTRAEWTLVGLTTTAIVLILASVTFRRWLNVSRLRDPNALRLNPSEPKHLLGRADDVARIRRALDRELVFLTGESGSGKSALLLGGLCHDLEVAKAFVPIYLDLADIDWDKGLVHQIATRFRQALPEQHRASFPVGNNISGDDLLAAFKLCGEMVGRKPLLLFDQFDDYAAHYRDQLQDEVVRAWRPAEEIATENTAWRMVRDGLSQRCIVALFTSRREDQGALDCMRLRTGLANLTLDRPPIGNALLIIDTVTARPTNEPPVIENAETTWPLLRRRIARDLEVSGALLPQQLKLVLQGLRSITRLSLRSYERAGGIEGLEAAAAGDAIGAAARLSGLGQRDVLNHLLLPLVDADRLPPGKAEPRAAAALAFGGVAISTVVEALCALADREIVRCGGDTNDPAAAWQLDHDYLARPLLRIKRERAKWQVVLDAQAGMFRGAGLNLALRWRALLPVRQQVTILEARLRGRLRYGSAAGFAIASVAGTLVASSVPVAGLGAAWLAWQFNDASRIDGTLASLGTQDDLSTNQRQALLELAASNWVVRWIVGRHTFTRPDQATSFQRDPEEIFLALTGLDQTRAGALVVRYATAILTSPKQEQASAAFTLLSIGAPALSPKQVLGLIQPMLAAIEPSTDPHQIQTLFVTAVPFPLEAVVRAYKAVALRLPTDARTGEALAQVLAAMKLSTDPSLLQTLAEAYQAVAAKLPAGQDARADEALAPVLAAMKQSTDPFQLRDLAEAYQAIAAKLPAGQDARAGEALAPVLAAMARSTDPSSLELLAGTYQAVAPKLPAGQDERAGEALVPILVAIKQSTDPSRLRTLEGAYQAVAGELAGAQVGEALAHVLAAIEQTTDPYQLQTLAGAYQTVAAKLPRDAQAGEAGTQVLAAIKRSADPYQLLARAEAYQAVAAKLPTGQNARAGEALTPVLAAIKRSTDPYQVQALVEAYRAVAAELSPGQEAHAGEVLAPALAAMKQSTDPTLLQALAEAYQAVATGLPVGQAARADEALAAILAAIKRSSTDVDKQQLVGVYQSVAVKLAEAHADEAQAQVLAAIMQTTDFYQLQTLAETYQMVAAKLPTGPYARASEALTPILAAIKRSTDPSQLPALAAAYQAVTAEFPPGQDARAREALAPILAAIKQLTDPSQLQKLVRTYQAVAAKLPADGNARDSLARVLAALQQSNPSQLQALAETYQAVAARLPAGQDARADEALAPVLAAMKRSTDPFQLRDLAEAYQAIAAELSAGQDARAGEALAPILAAMKQTAPSLLQALGEAYQAVAARQATSRRADLTVLDAARLRSTTSEAFGALSTAELMLIPDISSAEGKRLVAQLLRDPLSARPFRPELSDRPDFASPPSDHPDFGSAPVSARDYILDVAAKSVASNSGKRIPAWGHDIWSWVSWARTTPPSVDPDRCPPLQ